MAYQELTQYNSPNYTPENQVRAVYGMPRTIEGITYHWWGDPKHNPQFMNIVNYLCRQNGNTSAHVVGEAGRIAWIVDARHAAWHAGNARGNATTVGYECNPRLSDGDYETMGEFHYDMEKVYGRRLSIYVHKEWSATACSPIDKGRIRAIADRYHAGNVPKPAPAPPKPAPQPSNANIVYEKLPQPKEVIINKDTNLWNFNFARWGNAKAVRPYKTGHPVTVVAIAHNKSVGADYYMTAYSYNEGRIMATHGFNVKDCTDKPAAPPPVPAPIPKAPERPKPAPAPPRPAPEPSDVLVNNQDLEKRVSALEKIVSKIVEFLTNLFKGFKK